MQEKIVGTKKKINITPKNNIIAKKSIIINRNRYNIQEEDVRLQMKHLGYYW